MMLNKHSVDLNTMLNFLEISSRWGRRNRAIQCLRTVIRLKDLATLRVSDVIDEFGCTCSHFTSLIDGKVFFLTPLVRDELSRYLALEFGITEKQTAEIPQVWRSKFLFSTAKSLHPSANTLGQLCSKIDATIREAFEKSPII